MAATSSGTLVKTPRRSRSVLMSRKYLSTILSHDAEVGMKCMLNRGCFASHSKMPLRARVEPNYHSDGLPGRLPAALEGVEPQPHRRTAHKCLEPRAALVCSLRLFATASAIARIAFALRLSRGSAQLQIAFSDREAGRLSRRRLTRADSGALAVSVRKLPSSANSRAPADMLRAWLATDWHRIRDPYWWFSAVAVGIAASIIAGHLKQFIDRKFAGYSAAPK